MLKGIGFGKDASGEVVFWSSQKNISVHLDASLMGKILICQTLPDREFLAKASFLGLAGLVVPGIHYRDVIVKNLDLTILVLGRFGQLGYTKDVEERLRGLGENKRIKIYKLDEKFYALENNS